MRTPAKKNPHNHKMTTSFGRFFGDVVLSEGGLILFFIFPIVVAFFLGTAMQPF